MADNPIHRAEMIDLLSKLLVGAGRKMESAQDWARQLPRTPLAAEFLDQLYAEWPEVSPPDALGEDVAAEVRQRVSAWHGGWPHLWGHILRVTGAAVMIAEETDIDSSLAYLTGICHDVGKLDEEITGEAHEELGAAFVRRVLKGRLSQEQIDLIQGAILKESDGALADLLHDADKLDKIGAAGVMRRVSTSTDPGWVAAALERVNDDWRAFPRMHFEWSHDLAASKKNFLDWFLPSAQDVVRDAEG